MTPSIRVRSPFAQAMAEPGPLFSIVVPTYNRRAALGSCLCALAALDYPAPMFEVVVVDDGSAEPPEDLIAQYRDRLNLTLVCQTNSGPAAARNRGSALAGGRFLVFTDDDCRPMPDWLTQLERALEAAPDVMVGGHTRNGLPANPFSSASQLLMDYLYASSSSRRGSSFVASNNMAMSAALFQQIGGFDIGYPRAAGEDRDLCDRWCAYGYTIVHVPEAVIRHYHRLGWRGFWRQHRNYGRGAYRVHRTRADKASGRIRFEAISFYAGLLWYPFMRQKASKAAISALLLGLSQVATVAGFLMEALQSRSAQ